jgi:hypothetical protein
VRAIDWVIRDFGLRPWEKWDSQLVAEWRREIDIPENALKEAVHLRTDPLENDPDDDDCSSVDAADLLPNLGKAVPPWPVTFITWRRGIDGSRAELYAALVISQRGPDGRFAILALCFQDWGHDDPDDYQFAEAVLFHFDEGGVWDTARNAWLENGVVHARRHHPQTLRSELRADEMLYRHLLVRIGAHNADEPGHFEQLLRRLLAGDRELAEKVLTDANRTIDSPNPGSSYLGSSCESCDEYRIHLPSSVTFDTRWPAPRKLRRNERPYLMSSCFYTAAWHGDLHAVLVLIMAFRMVSSLRAAATSATLAGFPAARRRR